MKRQVVLVDLFDNEIGKCEKMKAHEKGVLHRAFSIFLFNGTKILIQKRAKNKYHSGGLWSNACCSHPQPGTDIFDCANARLYEELGIKNVYLTELFSFVYYEMFSKHLFEYEFDHVLIGAFCGGVKLNTDEASKFKWIECKTLARDVEKHPEKYTSWFKICCPKVMGYILQQKKRN